MGKSNLNAVVTGKIPQPLRAVIFGVSGCGKSTLAASMPTPLVLDIERGTDHLDVARLRPVDWAETFSTLASLASEPHEYKTVVLDTVDALEPMIWAANCKRDGQRDIEAYGYGKGYVAALDEWRKLITILDAIRAKGINVVLIGHAVIRTFKNPLGQDFDRYELKLNARAGALLTEWADLVGFANYETYAESAKGGRVKGVSTGARILHLERTAAFSAKNRQCLPASLPLDWAELSAALAAGESAPRDQLIAEIRRKAAGLGEAIVAKVEEFITKADTALKLAKLNAWVNSKLAAAQEPETTNETKETK